MLSALQSCFFVFIFKLGPVQPGDFEGAVRAGLLVSGRLVDNSGRRRLLLVFFFFPPVDSDMYANFPLAYVQASQTRCFIFV